jgi:hypothetical protein
VTTFASIDDEQRQPLNVRLATNRPGDTAFAVNTQVGHLPVDQSGGLWIRSAAGSFGPYLRLQSGCRYADACTWTAVGIPSVGVDANANALVSWSRGLDGLAVQQLAANGTSGPLQTLSATGIDPHVAVNASGQAVVAWQNSGPTIQAAAGP